MIFKIVIWSILGIMILLLAWATYTQNRFQKELRYNTVCKVFINGETKKALVQKIDGDMITVLYDIESLTIVKRSNVFPMYTFKIWV